MVFNIKTLEAFLADINCLYFLKRLHDGYKIYNILYKDFDYKNPINNESEIKQFFN